MKIHFVYDAEAVFLIAVKSDHVRAEHGRINTKDSCEYFHYPSDEHVLGRLWCLFTPLCLLLCLRSSLSVILDPAQTKPHAVADMGNVRPGGLGIQNRALDHLNPKPPTASKEDKANPPEKIDKTLYYVNESQDSDRLR